MKKILLSSLFYFGIFLPLIGFADNSGNVLNSQDQNQFSIEVSSKEVQIGESFKIILNITNKGDSTQVTTPTIPGIENFEIRGSSQSTSMNIINNFSEIKTSVIFNVVPLKEGLFNLGPAEINMGGKKIKSNTIPIKVNSGSNSNFFNGEEKKDDQVVPAINFSEDDKNSTFALQNILYVFGIILILSIGMTYFYIANIDKNKINKRHKKEKESSDDLLSIYDDFFEKKCLETVQDYFKKNYDIHAKNLTFSELILYEKNISKKEILEEIFELLSEKLYAKGEIDREKLLKLVENLKG